MYIYEGCLGELYVLDEALDYEELFCETCGDSDYLIGFANNRKEAWNMLKGGMDINDGSGGWNRSYVKEFIESNWVE